MKYAFYIEPDSFETDAFSNSCQYQFFYSVPSNFQAIIIRLHFLYRTNFIRVNQEFFEEEPCTVCNFQSMKSPVKLNSLFSKFFCCITWFVISPDQTRHWTTCKRGLYIKSYCFLETRASRFKIYKLLWRSYTERFVEYDLYDSCLVLV